MMIQERRRRRGTTVTQSLRYQLATCCEDGRIDAMVVADRDGLPLATAGDPYACEEVAARMVLASRRVREFDGVLLGPGHRWDVQMQRVEVYTPSRSDGQAPIELIVCTIGGTPGARRVQLARGAAGAARILAA